MIFKKDVNDEQAQNKTPFSDLFEVANAKKNTQTETPSLIVNNKIKPDGKIDGVDPTKPNSFSFNPSNNTELLYDIENGTFSNLNLNSWVIPYDNILQKYHNPSWNFTLYTMESSEYNLFWDSPSDEISKFVIAQSGVTGRYSINSVKMTSAGPATPGLTSNYSINSMTIEIQENGGMSLYDDIVVLSNELGYKKFLDVPLILELNFVGYDQVTGKPTVIPGVNKKWGVRINTITGQATQSGGSMNYTLQLTSTRAGIMDNKDWTMKEPYSCTVATFGEFVQQLEDQLNSMAEKQYGYLSLKYPSFANGEFFKMHVSDELASMTINYDSKQSPSVGTTKSGADGAKQFSWAANVPFSRAIDDVLDCCVPLHGTADTPRQFVNIIPLSRYVGFDSIRNTSAFKNDFYFIKYKIGDVVSKSDLEDDKFNLDYFLKNAYKVIDPDTGTAKLNIKRYDYQFSGLNNEIIALDLKFDQGFNLAVTRNPSSQIDVQNTRGTHTAETIEFGDVVYNTASRDDVQKMWERKSELEVNQRDQGYVLTDEDKQFIRDTNSAAANIQGVEGEQEQLSEIPFHAQETRYVEDFRTVRDVSIEGTAGIGRGIPRVDNIPIEPMNIETASSGTKRDNSSDAEMNRRLVRDNYYNRSFLAKLDMRVVGDPFWLGWGDYSYIEYLNRAVNGEDLDVSPSDLHFANYLTSEAYLLLNLKPIASISDITGILEINSSSVFAQTIYRVNKVVSEFTKDGKFMQTLQGGLVMRSLRRKDQYTDNTEGE